MKRKKRASFLKIYIKTDDVKLNIIPIPLWLAKGCISIILRLIKFSMKFSNDFDQVSKEDINEVLDSTKLIIREIKRYPPFSIIELESGDTKISIKTK